MRGRVGRRWDDDSLLFRNGWFVLNRYAVVCGGRHGSIANKQHNHQLVESEKRVSPDILPIVFLESNMHLFIIFLQHRTRQRVVTYYCTLMTFFFSSTRLFAVVTSSTHYSCLFHQIQKSKKIHMRRWKIGDSRQSKDHDEHDYHHVDVVYCIFFIIIAAVSKRQQQQQQQHQPPLLLPLLLFDL